MSQLRNDGLRGREIQIKSFYSRHLPSFCKTEARSPMDPVKMARLDQKKPQIERQNPIQFSKSNYPGKMKIFERRKLFD